MKTLSAYKIKWIMIVSVTDDGFPSWYKDILKHHGFGQIGPDGTMYGMHYNPFNPVSVDRVRTQLTALNTALSVKRPIGILSFTITDKQFGLIGKKIPFIKASVPCTLGWVPVTYQQMYESGCIPLPGSQALSNHPNLKFFS